MSFYAGGGASSSRNTHPDRRRTVNTFSLEGNASQDAYFNEQDRDEYSHPVTVYPRGYESTAATTTGHHSYQEARPTPIVGYGLSAAEQASQEAFAREMRALEVFSESEIRRQISERNDANIIHRYLYSQSGSPHDFLEQPRTNVERRAPAATAPQPPPSSSSYRSQRTTSSRQEDPVEVARQSEPYAEPHIFGFDHDDGQYEESMGGYQLHTAPPMMRERAYDGSERRRRDDRRH